MFHFLTISNLNKSKGTFVLLEAAQLLHHQAPDFHVHFVGAPTAEISAERMEREIENRALQKVVTYHGQQYTGDKDARFAEADCLVHPTLDDCFPLVILEAMQHALPVITTAVGAIPDMVLHRKSGVLIPENDAQALAAEMGKLMKNPALAAQYGATGRDFLLERYTYGIFETQLSLILSES